MKSVMVSLDPKLVEMICSDNMHVLFFRSSPNLHTPFKCYIYCSLALRKDERLFLKPFGFVLGGLQGKLAFRCDGKVVGEFVCDHIEQLSCKVFRWHIERFIFYDHPLDLFDFHYYNKRLVCDKCTTFGDKCFFCPYNSVVVRPPKPWIYVDV